MCYNHNTINVHYSQRRPRSVGALINEVNVVSETARTPVKHSYSKEPFKTQGYI
uniref:Uncharacterized protein n=1 Tax=Anguilla anguilla TaxID=7936 RepID=A0A0E9UIJ0_ANGAN